jgi:uncharacterized protein (DUF885 family)
VSKRNHESSAFRSSTRVLVGAGLRRPLAAALLAGLLGACAGGDGSGLAVPPPPAPTTAAASTALPASTAGASVKGPEIDAAFAAFASKFLAEYLQRSPVHATEAGDHRHDARWPDVTEAGTADFRAWVESTRKELAALPGAEGGAASGLSAQNRIDRKILETRLASWLFEIDELRTPEQNPLFYTGLIGDGIDPLVTRDFAPIEERMKSLRGRLEGIPAIVAAAKKRLKNPPKVHTETALQQNKGLFELCQTGLREHFVKVPAQKAALEAAATGAARALSDFQVFLEKDLLGRSGGDFRIGRAKLEKKLRFALEDDISADELVKGARALLARTQDEMAETAKEIWPTVMKEPLPAASTPEEKKDLIRKVMAQLVLDRSTNKTILADAKKTVADTTQFVREKDLVRVPTEPLEVIEMPEYRRGVSIAYCDASGPLEQKQETFYAISPTPKDWPAKRAESFYREYNRSMLLDLTIHEAMPGHFLQLMHANKFRSDVRAVFSSGAFVEGWAVYGEWLMAKHGFGGPKVRMMRQKMVLRLSANAILDHEVHAGTMDEKAALALMMGETFQEEGEAVAKWKRARLTSAQLTTYYYGFSEMMKLRAAAEAKPGFSERAYHDKLLSFGSPAMRYIRELMAP